jgi:uroporphyrinogen-III decarboxylase
MAELILSPSLHARALAQCVRELPVDGVYINLCLGQGQAAGAVNRSGTYQARLDDALDVKFGANDVLSVSATEIRTLEDPRLATAEGFHVGMKETFQAIPAEIREEVAVCVGLTGAFSQVGFLLGVQELMMAIMDDPEAVHRAIRLRQKAVLRQVEELATLGARFIWIGEGMASGSLISPDTYAEFVLPYEQEAAQATRRCGALSLLHICGSITSELTHIARSEVDGVDVDAPTDWQAAVDILGPSLCLKGNISPLLFLAGNERPLEEACQRALKPVKRAGGFIMSTGCLVPRDSTKEAFRIFARACGCRVNVS